MSKKDRAKRFYCSSPKETPDENGDVRKTGDITQEKRRESSNDDKEKVNQELKNKRYLDLQNYDRRYKSFLRDSLFEFVQCSGAGNSDIPAIYQESIQRTPVSESIEECLLENERKFEVRKTKDRIVGEGNSEDLDTRIKKILEKGDIVKPSIKVENISEDLHEKRLSLNTKERRKKCCGNDETVTPLSRTPSPFINRETYLDSVKKWKEILELDNKPQKFTKNSTERSRNNSPSSFSSVEEIHKNLDNRWNSIEEHHSSCSEDDMKEESLRKLIKQEENVSDRMSISSLSSAENNIIEQVPLVPDPNVTVPSMYYRQAELYPLTYQYPYPVELTNYFPLCNSYINLVTLGFLNLPQQDPSSLIPEGFVGEVVHKVISELKQVLSKDIYRKLVEGLAFQCFDNWNESKVSDFMARSNCLEVKSSEDEINKRHFISSEYFTALGKSSLEFRNNQFIPSFRIKRIQLSPDRYSENQAKELDNSPSSKNNDPESEDKEGFFHSEENLYDAKFLENFENRLRNGSVSSTECRLNEEELDWYDEFYFYEDDSSRGLRVMYPKRDLEQEREVLTSFLVKGIDTEDIFYVREAYKNLNSLDNPGLLPWLKNCVWMDHPPTYWRIPKWMSRKYGLNMTGSARSERVRRRKRKKVVERESELELEPSLTRFRNVSNTHEEVIQVSPKSPFGKKSQTILRDARITQRSQIEENDRKSELTILENRLRLSASPIHGWGLFAKAPIAEGENVIEYVGQLIRPVVADVREKNYKSEGLRSTYFFAIDDGTVIDATKSGNLSRFINHSCDPNCCAKVCVQNGKKKIVIYAKRAVMENEEITYDYKMKIEKKKIPCYCRSANCLGTLN